VKDNHIVDTTDELKHVLSGYNYLLYPIYEDNRVHPCNQKLSALYLCDNVGWTRCIIPLNHSEQVNELKLIDVMDSMKDFNLFVYDKKSFLNHAPDNGNLFDMQLVFYFTHNEITEPRLFQQQYNKWKTFSKINTLIPLSVLFDQVNKWVWENGLPHTLTEIWSISKNKEYRNYESILQTLQEIESNGIYHKDNGLEYTQYNPFTTTGRPSNRFGGINYAAMNKTDDTREKYIPRYEGGKFYLYDYSAFHPTIISNYLKIDRPRDKSIHQWLGEQYFNKQTLTPEEYEESKKLTFYYLYGDMTDVMGIPFYQKTSELIKSFDSKDKIVTPVFKREILTDGMSKEKVFNYFLQSMETEINFVKMKQLNRLLSGKQTKLILYTYDSFLIDYHPNEDINILKEIKKILEWGDFTVTISQGNDYKNMEYISYL